MPPPIAPSVLQRLAYTRFLYELGVTQSRHPDPFGSVAVLTWHDAVELVLHLMAEHHEVFEKKIDFIGYFSILEKQGIKLKYREQMRRLNDARVGLKHHGNFPSRVSIEEFRVSVASFLDENVPLALEIDYGRISLTDFVTNAAIRDALKRAEEALENADYPTALAEAAMAFRRSLREYERRPRSTEGHSRPYVLREAATGRLSFLRNDLSLAGGGRSLTESLRQIADVFSDAITVIGLGLDFEGYVRFKSHQPVVHEHVGGEMIVEWGPRPLPSDPETVRDCVSFVIDTAIILDQRT